MTWLWIILIVVAGVFIYSYLDTGDSKEAATNAAGAGMGCGFVILQIFLAIAGMWLLFKVAQFLFT